MPKRYTAEELMKIIKKDGWELNRVRGSHHIYTHNIKKGTVTIPFHKGELKPFIVSSILKQAGLK